MRRGLGLLFPALLAALLACAETPAGLPGPGGPGAGDDATAADSGEASDADPGRDAATVDAGSTGRDASAGDLGAGVDAGAPPDAGFPLDGGEVPDAGLGRFGRWSTLAPLPDAQQETAVVALDGRVHVIGGFDGRRAMTARVSVYDPGVDAWSLGVALPEPLHHANAAVVEGRIWILGYLVANFEAQGAMWSWAPGEAAWRSEGTMPGTARGASGVAVLGGAIYVVGGQDGGRTTGASDRFDPATGRWEALPPIPTPANHLVAGAIGGLVYAVGGRGAGISAHTREVWALDPNGRSWSPRAAMPTSRAGCAGAVIGGRLVVIGGEGNPAPGSRGVFAEVEAYDPVADAWLELARMRTPRHGMGAAAIGGAVYVPGGGTEAGFDMSAVHEALEPPP